MTGSRRYAAVDLGASAGRVMVGELGADRSVRLREVHRFANRPVRIAGELQWDIRSLWDQVRRGLRSYDGELAAIGVDSWAVDYALLDGNGELVGNPVHYRDGRTTGVPEDVDELISAERLFEITGIQRLPINTIYQLYAARRAGALEQARHALLIPDLVVHRLTGSWGSELTNASTTALLSQHRKDWASEVFGAVQLPTGLFPPVVPPGSQAGPVTDAATGQLGVPVIRVGSHDTASAVVGVPTRTPDFAFISCGTWSLVGVELRQPVLSEDARRANFSNELGVDGTVRFLHNVMGLWLLQESMRQWVADGESPDLPALLEQAALLPAGAVIDVDAPDFLPPGDMPARITEACRRSGQPVPAGPAQLVRCILDSLAEAYRGAVDRAAALSGKRIEVVHLVGGGARNALLCQLTADRTGRPVLAGPVEATALGNVLVQARADGAVTGELMELRQSLVSQVLRCYEPRG